MSLLDIGSRCSHAACSEVDFLPILCKCNKSYCGHHISPESHQCSAAPDSTASQHSFHKLRRCHVSNCSHPSLNAFTSNQDVNPTCIACKESFCAVHRHPSSHSCPTQGSLPSEMAIAAHALLSKHFPSSSNRKTTRRVPKAPTNPAKLEKFRKVELMKMRHRAIPGDSREGSQSIPFDQRIHLKFKGDEEKALWFRKTMIAGKVLDILALHAKMKSLEQSSLQLNKFLDNNSWKALRNDQPIGDQVEDGDTVNVTYV